MGTLKWNANKELPPKMIAGRDFTHCTESKWCRDCTDEQKSDCEDELQIKEYQRELARETNNAKKPIK